MNYFLHQFLLLTLCSTSMLIHAKSIVIEEDPQFQIVRSTNKAIPSIIYFDEEGATLNEKPKINKDGFYRKVLGQTAKGWYVVQDFYQKNDHKQSNPFILKEKADLTKWVTGETEGIITQWHPNGQQSLLIYFINSKREGLASEWYEDGSKKTEAYFKNDKAEGVQTSWHQNGQKSLVMNVANDLREGPAHEWYEDGTKKLKHFI